LARLISGIAEKHKLSPKPFIVVNKAGGAGAEGFLDVKNKKGDAHTIIITLSNLFHDAACTRAFRSAGANLTPSRDWRSMSSSSG